MMNPEHIVLSGTLQSPRTKTVCDRSSRAHGDKTEREFLEAGGGWGRLGKAGGQAAGLGTQLLGAESHFREARRAL